MDGHGSSEATDGHAAQGSDEDQLRHDVMLYALIGSSKLRKEAWASMVSRYLVNCSLVSPSLN